MTSNHYEHDAERPIRCAVLTVSDTRTPETDVSGPLVRTLLESAGHDVATAEIVPDDPATITERVLTLCRDPGIDAVLLTGGTGPAARDTTHEALSVLFDKRLDGFGELFRVISYERIGSAAMLSRAVAGVRDATAIFSMPGSTGAVRTAMDPLILPQLRHLVGLLAE